MHSPLEKLDLMILQYDLNGLARPDTWLISSSFARDVLFLTQKGDFNSVDIKNGRIVSIRGFRTLVTDQDVDVIPAWTSPPYPTRKIR